MAILENTGTGRIPFERENNNNNKIKGIKRKKRFALQKLEENEKKKFWKRNGRKNGGNKVFVRKHKHIGQLSRFSIAYSCTERKD